MSGYIGTQPVPQATQTRDSFTATSGQTSFATGGYTPNFLDVYLNGVKLASADYTATNGSDVVLASGAATGDILEVVAYTTFTVGSSFTPSIDDNGNATALTIDSSENVMVGKAGLDFGATAGVEFRKADGRVFIGSTDGAFVNRIGSDGSIIGLRKDGTTVGSIQSRGSTVSTFILDPRTNGGGLTGTANAVMPTSNAGAIGDANTSLDLGASGYAFRNAYLSGGVYLGGTGSANKLDDYEEGTFTPVYDNVSAPSYSNQTGKYKKIGKLVHVQVMITCSGLDTSDGSGVIITGFPFNVDTTTESIVFTLGRTTNILANQAVLLRNVRAVSTGVILLKGSDDNIPYNGCNSSGTLQFSCTYTT